MRRIVLSSGGTGGHIYPALAVAEELKDKHPEAELLFIGSDRGLENKLASQANLSFQGLPVQGFLGKGLRSFKALFFLFFSMIKCWFIYRRFRPEIVIGFGSYAGFVPVLMAVLKRIPTAIHEQNNQPGLSNKILGKKVKKVFLTYPDEKQFFDSEKTIITGNPVRKSLVDLRYEEKVYMYGSKAKVLIFGGSQGAKGINDAVLKSLSMFKSLSIQLMHQTGTADWPRVSQTYKKIGLKTDSVYPFIEDMVSAYRWADIVVSRAGASTLSELTVIGRPSILIPFPYAVKNHQLNNARLLERMGAAIVLEQSYLQDMDLARVISDLIAVPEKLKEMGQAAKKLGQENAAESIAIEMEKMTYRVQ